MTESVHPDIIKAAIGGSFALASWTAGQLAQAAEEAPAWLKAADTPLVIGGLAYAVVHLWRELKKAQETLLKKIEDDSARSQEARERLIKATVEQTVEFKELRKAITHKDED